ncbi:hypothetical protein L208DRAFT_1213621, partial [Tricholoma matsutake]
LNTHHKGGRQTKTSILKLYKVCSDFDVTKGTILKYELHPEQFEEVTAAIFGMDQGTSSMVHVPYILLSAHLPAVNSIVKSHFAWNWQSATLNWGNELVCLLLAFLQPYAICLVDSTYSNGRPVHLMFGRTVKKVMTSNGISKMYKGFLEETSISSSKKVHLARWTIPTLLEDMGMSTDHIDAVGHWVGNVHREVYGCKIPKQAVTALAGFYVRETYWVP